MNSTLFSKVFFFEKIVQEAKKCVLLSIEEIDIKKKRNQNREGCRPLLMVRTRMVAFYWRYAIWADKGMMTNAKKYIKPKAEHSAVYIPEIEIAGMRGSE